MMYGILPSFLSAWLIRVEAGQRLHDAQVVLSPDPPSVSPVSPSQTGQSVLRRHFPSPSYGIPGGYTACYPLAALAATMLARSPAMTSSVGLASSTGAASMTSPLSLASIRRVTASLYSSE